MQKERGYAMAYSCSSSSGISRNPYSSSCSRLRLKLRVSPQATSQSFREDDGKSSNTVDSKMSVLRKRMEVVRARERLDACYEAGGNGWNYRSGYDDVRNIHNFAFISIQLASIVFTSIGLVFLIGSLCMLLLYFFLSSLTLSN